MSQQFTNCTMNDIQLISGYAETKINTNGYFKINKFSKISNNFDKLSDDEKISLFKNSNGNMASIDELESIGKPLKTLIYTKKKP